MPATHTARDVDAPLRFGFPTAQWGEPFKGGGAPSSAEAKDWELQAQGQRTLYVAPQHLGGTKSWGDVKDEAEGERLKYLEGEEIPGAGTCPLPLPDPTVTRLAAEGVVRTWALRPTPCSCAALPPTTVHPRLTIQLGLRVLTPNPPMLTPLYSNPQLGPLLGTDRLELVTQSMIWIRGGKVQGLDPHVDEVGAGDGKGMRGGGPLGGGRALPHM